MNRLPWFDALRLDVRFAFRMFVTNPTFTAVAVATIALGIGINTAVFTVANAALLKGFPLVKENDRVLYITNRSVPYPEFEDWRAAAASFSEMAGTQGLFKFVSGSADAPEVYSGTPVTTNTFHVLRVTPRLGRDFTPDDGKEGAAAVAILSYDLWQRRFAADPNVIGRMIQLNAIPTSVIGVMPEGFLFPQKQDLWLPIVPNADMLRRDRSFFMLAVGRLAGGARTESARAEIEAIGRRLQRDYTQTRRDIPVVKDFNEMFIGDSATTLYKIMFAAVGFLLLIACTNVANLLLGRVLSRAHEITVRAALGAGRWRIVRQLLIESVLLSSGGGVLAWWIAKTVLRLYVQTQRSDSWFPQLLPYAMDYRVLVYCIGISAATGVLFGVLPAFRLSKLDLNVALKDAGRGVFGGRQRNQLSAILIAGEVALTVVLLAGAGAMVRSFFNIYRANVGARTENVLAAYVNLPANRYPDAGTQISFYEDMKSRLEALPAVESVAIGPAPTESLGQYAYEISGAAAVNDRPLTITSVVSPGYFHTLGANVLAGREFSDLDHASSMPVTIVNERFASRNWPGDSALGKHLRLFRNGKKDVWLTVVGVVTNVTQNDPTRQHFDPLVYLPFQQSPAGGISIVARTRVASEDVFAGLPRALHSVDPTVPFQHLAPLTTWMSVIGGTYEIQRNISVLFVVFGATALLLASIGLYAVVAHSVSQRTQEIGIRAALGATARDIRRLVFRNGAVPVAIGLGTGVLACAALNRIVEAQLVHARPADPLILVAVSAVLMSFAALGCWVPARRATRVDLVRALTLRN